MDVPFRGGGTVGSVVFGPSVAHRKSTVSPLSDVRQIHNLFSGPVSQHLRASLLCWMMSGLIYVFESFFSG